MPLERVLACGHTAPPGQDCAICGPSPAKRAESQRKRSKQSYIEVYNTPRWKQLRLAILRRDRFTCRYGYAGCTRRATVAAHLHPFTNATDPHTWDEANLIASCAHCNSSEASKRWRATRKATA